MGEVLMNDEIILEDSESVDPFYNEYYEYSENEYNIRTDQGSDEVNYQTIEDDTIPEQEDQKEEFDETVLILNDIKYELGVIRDDLRNNQKVGVDDSRSGVSAEYVSDNSIISVSSNIIDTPLNEYSISESILTLIFVGLFVAGMALVIKRSLFKWK